MEVGCIIMVCLCFGITVAGCGATGGINNNNEENQQNDARQQVEEEFGAITDEQIAAFEREIVSQYRQLQMAYAEYDERLDNAHDSATDDGDENRLHRRLQRRHQTLGRLHEDRMWLHVGSEGPSTDDRHLAEIHRAAARWHEEHFDDDASVLVEPDTDLEIIRDEIIRVGPNVD